MEEKHLKLKGKKTKLKEKTQNSREKLMVREALASYVYPSGVKKKPAIYVSMGNEFCMTSSFSDLSASKFCEVFA